MGMWAYSGDSLSHSVSPSSWRQEFIDEWHRVLPWRLFRALEVDLDPRVQQVMPAFKSVFIVE